MSLDQSFSLKPTKSQFIGLLVIFGLILILSWALTLVQQRQEWRRRAWGTGEVLFSLVPGSGGYQPGDDFAADVVMTNQYSTSKTIRVSGLELEFDESVFEISSVSCNETIFPPFYHPDSGEKLEIPGFGYDASHPGEIHLTCYRPPQDGEVTVEIPGNGAVTLGSIVGKIKESAFSGESQIIARRAVIPEDLEEPVDIANPEPQTGQPLVLGAYVIGGGVATPTPTPTIEGPTPTPTLPPEPTPTDQPGKGHLGVSLKFQGIIDEKPVRGVDVILKQGAEVQTFENQGLVYAGNSVYTVEIRNLEPGTYDTILLKGWAHLQRICAGEVVIVADQNTEKDCTGQELLAGNVANTDNVVNIQDFGILADSYLQTGPGLAADFNLDNVINIQDFLFISENYLVSGEE